ncbi:MAG: SRPBCC family protein [Blastococcus sp.]
MTDIRSVTVDQFVAAPRERVWAALTEPDLLARWWVGGDIAPIVGHRFTLQMGQWGEIPCEMVEVREPELLAYTFNTSWTLTWELVAEGNGTRLLLEHAAVRPRRPAGPLRVREHGHRLARRRPPPPRDRAGRARFADRSALTSEYMRGNAQAAPRIGGQGADLWIYGAGCRLLR